MLRHARFTVPLLTAVLSLPLSFGWAAADTESCSTRFVKTAQSQGAYGEFGSNQPTLVGICEGLVAQGADISRGAAERGSNYVFCGHHYGSDDRRCWWSGLGPDKSQGIDAKPYVGNRAAVEKMLRAHGTDEDGGFTVSEKPGVTWFGPKLFGPRRNDSGNMTRPAEAGGFLCEAAPAALKASPRLGRDARCGAGDCWIGVKLNGSATGRAQAVLDSILVAYIERGLCPKAARDERSGASQCPDGYVSEGDACVAAADPGNGIRIEPDQARIAADGQGRLRFTLTLVDKGRPLADERVTITLDDPRRRLTDLGRTLPATVTDARGRAEIHWTAPQLPDNFPLSEYTIELRARHRLGNPKAHITLADARPRIRLRADPRSVQEGEGQDMSVITVEIDDPGSKRWMVEPATALGSLSKTVSVNGNGKATTPLRWLAPDPKVALRDHDETILTDDDAAYTALKGNLERAINGLGQDADERLAVGSEAYYNDLKGSAAYLKEDYRRLSSASHDRAETFLNMLSAGLEGLQVWVGSKGMYEAGRDRIKAELRGQAPSDDLGSRISDGLNGARDAFIGYGVDLLQSRLRGWADAIHEGNLSTLRLPVPVVVRVRDETGLENTRTLVIQYTYHFNPKVHFDRINNPDAR
ncbi:MAG: hypothetical protein ACPGUC_00340 [Gammaproteobacteria bacterium]